MSVPIEERSSISVSCTVDRPGTSALDVNADGVYKIIGVDLGGASPDVRTAQGPYQHGEVAVRSRLQNRQVIIQWWVYGATSAQVWSRYWALQEALTLPLSVSVNLTIDGQSHAFTSNPAEVMILGSMEEQKEMLYRCKIRVQAVFSARW